GWFGTLRPRLGYAWDRTLVYATGGLAVAEITHSMRFVDNFGFTAQDHTTKQEAGWVVGGGVEQAFSAGWRPKLGDQCFPLGNEHYTAPLRFGPGGATTVFTENTDTRDNFHTVRLGLNYKFGLRDEAPLK